MRSAQVSKGTGKEQKRPTKRPTSTGVPEVRTCPEVDDSEDLSAWDFGDEYVCGFDISVYDPVRVQHLRETVR